MDRTNELVKSFRRIRTELQSPDSANLRLRIVGARGSNNGDYSIPTGTEIAALIPGDFSADKNDRDIIINHRAEGLRRITSLNPKFEALHFPILFPYGEDGFHTKIRYRGDNTSTDATKKYVTQREYYAFRLQHRQNEGTTLLRGGKALQHYIVDAFSTIDQNRLIYLRNHQKELRSEFYQGDNLGNIILPATYTGSPRYMRQLFLDSTSICQYFGNPHLFITSKCKPHIVARVFEMKLRLMKDQLDRNHFFGQTIAAELPDPEIDPLGYETVTKFMLHGPCGAANLNSPCMKNGVCSKGFPKAFCSTTTTDQFGYVVYRRRDLGITATKGGTVLDNRYVVPFNRNLLVLFQAHINVELCHQGRVIKYLFKYLTKGPDRHQKLRNIMARPNVGETTLTRWFKLNERDPKARELTYDEIPNKYVWKEDSKDWFPCKKGFAIGRIAYIHPGANDTFYLRQLLTKVRGALSFVHLRTVNGTVCRSFKVACQKLGLLANDDEWLLVMNEVGQWGMCSLLRTLFVSMLMFCELANPIDLFNKTWELMAKDISYKYRRENRDYAAVADSEIVKNRLLQQLDHLLAAYTSSLAHFGLPTPTLDHSLSSTDHLLSAQLNYDAQVESDAAESMLRKLNFRQAEAFKAIIQSVAHSEGKLFFLYGHGGTGKTFLYKAVTSKLRSQRHIVLVVASSGIAATLLPDAITAHSRFKIPLEIDQTSTCMVKKGTALADLLSQASLIIWDEAPMVHRMSFEAVDRTLCDIMDIPLSGIGYKPFAGKTILLGGDFRQTLPVIPDAGREESVESSFTRSYLWSYCHVLHLTQNMRIDDSPVNSSLMFDGMEFADWVLAIGNGLIPSISLKPDSPADYIRIPDFFLIEPSDDPVKQITTEIYESFSENFHQAAYLTNRAIVAPTNEDVSKLNAYVLAQVPGPTKNYYSADTLSSDSKRMHELETLYPTEFLNSLSFNGIPEHVVTLKVFTPIMLLRNLNPSIGLCNGTRIMTTFLGDYVIKGVIIGGSFEGSTVAIPRVILNINDSRWPFILKRRQFPIRLCYGMTINKSQGQTLERVGIYLPKPVFSHGQLYVAISRVKSASGLRILLLNDPSIPHGYTRNIVYTETFKGIEAPFTEPST
ncbi:ATP-dependent DNA helicase pif1 [Linum perenne]